MLNQALQRGRADQTYSSLTRPAVLPHSYATFFLAAHLAFIIADNLLRAAGLIGVRPACFFWADAAFFGAAVPFCFAQRARCAAAILARADALMVRRFLPATRIGRLVLGGRPRRGDRVPSPTSAAIACSIRVTSCLSCATRS